MIAKNDINLKCINLTVHLKDSADFKAITYDIHDYLKAIVERNKLNLDRTPAVISSLDYSGSREWFRTNKNPHIHVMIILAQQECEATISNYINLIEKYLEKNDLVNKKITIPVEIHKFITKKYDGLNDQTINIIDYNRKAKFNRNCEENIIVLPYNDLVQYHKNENFIERLREKANTVFEDLKNNVNFHHYYSETVV